MLVDVGCFNCVLVSDQVSQATLKGGPAPGHVVLDIYVYIYIHIYIYVTVCYSK